MKTNLDQHLMWLKEVGIRAQLLGFPSENVNTTGDTVQGATATRVSDEATSSSAGDAAGMAPQQRDKTKDGTARSSPQRAAVNRNSSRPQGTAVQRSDARPMLQPIAANDLNIEDGRGKSWPQPVQVPSHCKPNHARRTPFMQSPPNPTSANIEPQDDPIPVSDVDDEIFASIDLDQLIKPAYESAPRPTYAPPPDATSVITISQAKTNNTRPLSPSTASRIDELEKERKRVKDRVREVDDECDRLIEEGMFVPQDLKEERNHLQDELAQIAQRIRNLKDPQSSSAPCSSCPSSIQPFPALPRPDPQPYFRDSYDHPTSSLGSKASYTRTNNSRANTGRNGVARNEPDEMQPTLSQFFERTGTNASDGNRASAGLLEDNIGVTTIFLAATTAPPAYERVRDSFTEVTFPQNNFNRGSFPKNDFRRDGFQQSSYEEVEDAPPCHEHGVKLILLTSKTDHNLDRKFWKCPVEGCKAFHWDDELQQSGLVKDYRSANRKIFGHQQFRAGQEKVIRCAMEKQDVFVLMPTGGGKSLCYQLPAYCAPGLAVVFSPLISLIQDQVDSMNEIGVRAVFLNSQQDYQTTQRDIMNELYHLTPHDGIKLLYITPEKISKSDGMVRCLQRLYERNLISRFVIDEAHCISQWGHSFRPDYMELRKLRTWYPNVPIMALTATANDRIREDATRLLQMKRPYLEKQSFNRPNLLYEVRQKSKNSLKEIAEYIKKNSKSSGIIYCLSKKDTEKMAQEVEKETGMKTLFYHADLRQDLREKWQKEWSSGRVKVIVATVAFGMGINKPDVRFVIHYSLPKSLTHYYQESGRAGRDGLPSTCILYYAYKDKRILEGMIKKGMAEGNQRSFRPPAYDKMRQEIDNLYKCVNFCANEIQCRRVLILEHFGEPFKREYCKKTCDNCKSTDEIEENDLTELAQGVIRVVKECQNMQFTLNHLLSIVRGETKNTFVRRTGAEEAAGFGIGKDYTKAEMERILQQMVLQRFLNEDLYELQNGFTADYISLGDDAGKLTDGQKRFVVAYRTKKRAGKKSKKKDDIVDLSENDEIEILSAESQGHSGSKKQKRKSSALLSGQKAKRASKNLSDPNRRRIDEHHAMELVRRLEAWRASKMDDDQHRYWNILNEKQVIEIGDLVPRTEDELSYINGFGQHKILRYGQDILSVINKFLAEENIKPKGDFPLPASQASQVQNDLFETFNYNGPQDIFPCSQMPQSEGNQGLQTEDDCLYDDEFFKGIEMIEKEAEKSRWSSVTSQNIAPKGQTPSSGSSMYLPDVEDYGQHNQEEEVYEDFYMD